MWYAAEVLPLISFPDEVCLSFLKPKVVYNCSKGLSCKSKYCDNISSLATLFLKNLRKLFAAGA